MGSSSSSPRAGAFSKSVTPGTAAVIKRVGDQDPAKLRYLATLGLFPQVRVTLLEKAPFGGPMSLEVGDTRCTLGGEMARQIYVLPIEAL